MRKRIPRAVLVFCGVAALVAAAFWFRRDRPIVPSKTVSEKSAMVAPTLPVPKLSMANSGDNKDAGKEIVFVPRVIDGDTIVVESVDPVTGEPGKPETVRYIGMDTPETVHPTKPVECYGHEASERNKALVLGKYVAIVRDMSDHDKYGRLLRFVYLLGGTSSSDATALGTFVDLELVKDGYARQLTIPPDTEFEVEFKTAATAAKANKLGFWSACAEYPFK